jgi:hypothetical protein
MTLERITHAVHHATHVLFVMDYVQVHCHGICQQRLHAEQPVLGTLTLLLLLLFIIIQSHPLLTRQWASRQRNFLQPW